MLEPQLVCAPKKRISSKAQQIAHKLNEKRGGWMKFGGRFNSGLESIRRKNSHGELFLLRGKRGKRETLVSCCAVALSALSLFIARARRNDCGMVGWIHWHSFSTKLLKFNEFDTEFDENIARFLLVSLHKIFSYHRSFQQKSMTSLKESKLWSLKLYRIHLGNLQR
jgi:hypothetical protein